ncbi:glutathionylspermidine synthase family protein [Thermoactinomyces sp. DSM 45892]|uniref:glutathionylspermidine synthase family protein n=1 Tax=Thermoactinomyces sp. DSM 45892 TaxID=1882753 RepID=UPI000896E38C|nr:glutathionylspermidine synthase family protein [Thermoactinomyces sp. DSM 45892]SDZ20604.1 Glutathionylspermidine synthase [Thermoactinomyces sp. DSM 45892]
MSKYNQTREQMYTPIREQGIFNWDLTQGQEYALGQCVAITESFVDEIRVATQRIGDLYGRLTRFLQQGFDPLLSELGIPREALPFCHTTLPLSFVTTIGRFDFACTPQGIKMMEFNSDTPTSVVEAYYVNEQVCRFFGMENPNHGMEAHIKKAFQQTVTAYQESGYDIDTKVFTSIGGHAEDEGTAKFLMRHGGIGGRFIPLSQLGISLDDHTLCYMDEGNWIPVDVLYRLHAGEFFAKDQTEQGYPIGEHILQLVAGKRLAMINPPSAFVAQTKAIQALIWSLHEQNQFFTPEEHEVIETYFLPTYLDNEFSGERPYVKKPILGREGGAVTLYSAEDKIIAKDGEGEYKDQMMVYQELAELPTMDVETLKGPYRGKLLWGCFYVGGQASALVTRLDREITGNLAYYLPFGYK